MAIDVGSSSSNFPELQGWENKRRLRMNEIQVLKRLPRPTHHESGRLNRLLRTTQSTSFVACAEDPLLAVLARRGRNRANVHSQSKI